MRGKERHAVKRRMKTKESNGNIGQKRQVIGDAGKVHYKKGKN